MKESYHLKVIMEINVQNVGALAWNFVQNEPFYENLSGILI